MTTADASLDQIAPAAAVAFVRTVQPGQAALGDGLALEVARGSVEVDADIVLNGSHQLRGEGGLMPASG